jgi:hypothetical protein
MTAKASIHDGIRELGSMTHSVVGGASWRGEQNGKRAQ